MTDLKKIQEITGAAPNECDCPTCANMCYRCPCLATPQEVLNLMNNGYADKLTGTTWAAGIFLGLPIIEMVQLKYDEDKSRCVMLNDDHKCILHAAGLKPSEGVLATCDMETARKHKVPPVKVVAMTWCPEAGPHFSNTAHTVLKGFSKYSKLKQKSKI